MSENLKISEFTTRTDRFGVGYVAGVHNGENVKITPNNLMKDYVKKSELDSAVGIENVGKIKVNETDDLDYLETKLNNTITIENNKLTSVSLKNLIATIQELNELKNISGNVQDQLNSLLNKINNLPQDRFLENKSFDPITNILTLILSDGSQFEIDLKELVDVYTAKQNGGLDVQNNEFFIKNKGVLLSMLSDEVILAINSSTESGENIGIALTSHINNDDESKASHPKLTAGKYLMPDTSSLHTTLSFVVEPPLSWNPTLPVGFSFPYITQKSYIRNGRECLLQFNASIKKDADTATGNFTMGGIPYTTHGGYLYPGSISYDGIQSAFSLPEKTGMHASGSELSFLSGTTFAQSQSVEIGTTFGLTFAISYIIA